MVALAEVVFLAQIKLHTCVYYFLCYYSQDIDFVSASHVHYPHNFCTRSADLACTWYIIIYIYVIATTQSVLGILVIILLSITLLAA